MGENRQPLRFAVFGTGFWSTLQIPAWLEIGGVSCVAVWNRTHARALDAAERYNIPNVYKDAEELLKHEELDFADIITEVPAHEELVLLCAIYKVPVICQKPMSGSYESCVRMVEACKSVGIPFFIHENWRYRAPFMQLKKVLETNPIGRIRRVEFNGVNGGRSAYTFQPFLKTLPHMILTDLGSHMFDLARFLFGEPESLYCRALRIYDDLAGENYMAAILGYPDKLCTVTIGERMDHYVFLDGELGALAMNKDYTIVIEKDTGEREVFTAPIVPQYRWAQHTKEYIPPDHVENIVRCNQSFYDALRSNTPPDNTAEQNLKTMRLVFAACDSVETGKEVNFFAQSFGR